MGMTFSDARHLLQIRKGARGGSAVTLGRQCVFLHFSDLRALRTLIGQDAAASAWLKQYKWGDYADLFFQDVLKFDTIDSIDVSNYEGATILHDFGEPIPPALTERFDLAFDGGTIEHVFNVPVALSNLMKLVRVDGIVYTASPSNNLCGHGFYQFSPELLYRVFSPANGYEIIFVRIAEGKYLSVELSTHHPIYDVRDPAATGGRVNLMTAKPVVIMTMARRTRACDPFAEKVLQSDYVSNWEAEGVGGGFIAKLKSVLRWNNPQLWSAPFQGLYMRRHASLSNRKSFQRVR